MPPPNTPTTAALLNSGTLNLQKTNIGDPKIQLPPGGGFAAIQSPDATAQKGITLRQAIMQAKANPKSQFANTLGGFITRGDADMHAMKEGIDLSFAGRPSLEQMYSDHLKMNGVEMPGESGLDHLRNGFLDLINKSADNTVEQQKEAGQKMTSSVEQGAQEIENNKGKYVVPGSPESRQPTTYAERKENSGALGGMIDSGLGTASGAVQGIFAPITGIIQAISDKASDTEAMQQFAEHGTGPILDLYDSLESKIGEIAKAHPEAAQNIGDAANVLLATLGGETDAARAGVEESGAATVKAVHDAGVGSDGGGGAGGAIQNAVQKTVGAIQDAGEGAGKAVADAATTAKNKIAGAGGGVKNMAAEGAKSVYNKVYGLPADTTDFLMQNPHFATPEALNNANIYNIGMDVQKAHAKATEGYAKPADIEEEVRQGLQKKIQALNEHAKQYSTLGNDAAPGAARKAVNVEPNWLADTLQKEVGVKVHEGENNPHAGQLEATGESKVNDSSSPGGLQRLQNLYREWGPIFAKGKISRATFLKFRNDLADMADYQGGLDTNMKQAAHRIRDAFNTTYRKQIPGLDKIDAEHARMERDLEDSVTGLATVDKSAGLPKIKMNDGAASNLLTAGKDTKGHLAKRLESISPGIVKKIGDINQFEDEWKAIFEENGNLKDNALNNIKNSVNAGRDLRLEKLESLLPGITEKLKLAKAAEDFHAALGPKAGLYAGPSMGITGALMGHSILPVAGAIPGWLAGMYAASPKVGLRILRAFAKHGAGN